MAGMGNVREGGASGLQRQDLASSPLGSIGNLRFKPQAGGTQGSAPRIPQRFLRWAGRSVVALFSKAGGARRDNLHKVRENSRKIGNLLGTLTASRDDESATGRIVKALDELDEDSQGNLSNMAGGEVALSTYLDELNLVDLYALRDGILGSSDAQKDVLDQCATAASKAHGTRILDQIRTHLELRLIKEAVEAPLAKLCALQADSWQPGQLLMSRQDDWEACLRVLHTNLNALHTHEELGSSSQNVVQMLTCYLQSLPSEQRQQMCSVLCSEQMQVVYGAFLLNVPGIEKETSLVPPVIATLPDHLKPSVVPRKLGLLDYTPVTMMERLWTAAADEHQGHLKMLSELRDLRHEYEKELKAGFTVSIAYINKTVYDLKQIMEKNGITHHSILESARLDARELLKSCLSILFGSGFCFSTESSLPIFHTGKKVDGLLIDRLRATVADAKEGNLKILTDLEAMRTTCNIEKNKYEGKEKAMFSAKMLKSLSVLMEKMGCTGNNLLDTGRKEAVLIIKECFSGFGVDDFRSEISDGALGALDGPVLAYLQGIKNLNGLCKIPNQERIEGILKERRVEIDEKRERLMRERMEGSLGAMIGIVYGEVPDVGGRIGRFIQGLRDFSEIESERTGNFQIKYSDALNEYKKIIKEKMSEFDVDEGGSSFGVLGWVLKEVREAKNSMIGNGSALGESGKQTLKMLSVSELVLSEMVGRKEPARETDPDMTMKAIAGEESSDGIREDGFFKKSSVIGGESDNIHESEIRKNIKEQYGLIFDGKGYRVSSEVKAEVMLKGMKLLGEDSDYQEGVELSKGDAVEIIKMNNGFIVDGIVRNSIAISFNGMSDDRDWIAYDWGESKEGEDVGGKGVEEKGRLKVVDGEGKERYEENGNMKDVLLHLREIMLPEVIGRMTRLFNQDIASCFMNNYFTYCRQFEKGMSRDDDSQKKPDLPFSISRAEAFGISGTDDDAALILSMQGGGGNEFELERDERGDYLIRVRIVVGGKTQPEIGLRMANVWSASGGDEAGGRPIFLEPDSWVEAQFQLHASWDFETVSPRGYMQFRQHLVSALRTESLNVAVDY